VENAANENKACRREKSGNKKEEKAGEHLGERTIRAAKDGRNRQSRAESREIDRKENNKERRGFDSPCYRLIL